MRRLLTLLTLIARSPSLSSPPRRRTRGLMLRKTLLYLSNQQRVFRFVRRNRLARRMASRFVAGETIDDAMAAVRPLNARGITASLDLLGESVHREEEARATARSYLDLLDRIQAEKLNANVSLKLTA